METETLLAKELKTIEQKKQDIQYDKNVKKVLGNKGILAEILKYCVHEFYGYDSATIGNCIQGTPEIATTAVNADEACLSDENITGSNNEDNTLTEQTIFYDIRFTAKVPDTDKPIFIIINVEAQRLDKEKYTIENRMIYYMSRLISAQYGTVFHQSHYEDIEKVYSIWFCMNKKNPEYKNTITRVTLDNQLVYGPDDLPLNNVDLMEGIVVNLGSSDSEPKPEILQLMNTLLDSDIEAEPKKQFLEKEFKIPMTMELNERMNDMCNLSQGIRQDEHISAYQEGCMVGRQEGRQEERQKIRENMRAAGFSDEMIDKVTMIQ